MSCRHCDETLTKLKTADWNRYEAQTRAVDALDHNRRLTMWIRETLMQARMRTPIPLPEDLARLYPMVPVETRPSQPESSDPRSAR